MSLLRCVPLPSSPSSLYSSTSLRSFASRALRCASLATPSRSFASFSSSSSSSSLSSCRCPLCSSFSSSSSLSSPSPLFSSFLRHFTADPSVPSLPSVKLSSSDVTQRVVAVLKKFDRADPAKVHEGVNFNKDLGLDSLDGVEIVMALEDEFGIEISDADADKIVGAPEAIKYILGREDAK